MHMTSNPDPLHMIYMLLAITVCVTMYCTSQSGKSTRRSIVLNDIGEAKLDKLNIICQNAIIFPRRVVVRNNTWVNFVNVIAYIRATNNNILTCLYMQTCNTIYTYNKKVWREKHLSLCDLGKRKVRQICQASWKYWLSTFTGLNSL